MISKTVVLPCAAERAFVLFTEHAGLWWPTGRRHTNDAASVIRIEPTGRFYERASDGTEVELGVVQQFEPSSRLVLDWYPGTDSANPTRVEVEFESVDGGTRVTVSHGPGRAGAERFGRNAPAYDASWDLVLSSLAAATARVLDLR